MLKKITLNIQQVNLQSILYSVSVTLVCNTNEDKISMEMQTTYKAYYILTDAEGPEMV